MLYSVSAVKAGEDIGNQYYYLKRQLIWSLLGLLLGYFMYRYDYRKWQAKAKVMFLGITLLLVAVLVFGYEAGGAKRWFRFAGISFQPSEPAKLIMILVIADYLDRKKSNLPDFWKGFIPPIVVAGAVASLIALEPDLGTSLLICSITGALLFAAGARIKHFLVIILLLSPVLYWELFSVSWRYKRLLAFMDPWSNAMGASYQLTQSLIALGSGGVLGNGAGSSMTKLFFLPETTTDFIFSIIGEEFGFIRGILFVILPFLILTYTGLKITQNAASAFGFYTALGITIMIAWQALLNLGVVSGLLPTKGIPLPFISSGGTSLVVLLCSIGLLLNIGRHQTERHKSLAL